MIQYCEGFPAEYIPYQNYTISTIRARYTSKAGQQSFIRLQNESTTSITAIITIYSSTETEKVVDSRVDNSLGPGQEWILSVHDVVFKGHVQSYAYPAGIFQGSARTFIATILKGASNTLFTVQNTGTASTDVTIDIYNTSAILIQSIFVTIAPGVEYWVDAGQISSLGSSFSGSAVIEASNSSLVSSAIELDTGSCVSARAFEGVGAGSQRYYMPSALCNYGDPGQTASTYYAVQNTSLDENTSVLVRYSNSATQSASIGSGAKASFSTCSAEGMTSGFLGSATIESYVTPVVAIGKAADGGKSTAFVGFTEGANRLALPYVRWTWTDDFYNGTRQRVFIAIQNVGEVPITDNILVKYVDKDGKIAGTHTITQDLEPGARVNTDPSMAGSYILGYYYDGSAGAGAIIEVPEDNLLAAIARATTYDVNTGLIVAEDYNAQPIP